jgi:hypothetical protein
VGFWRDLQPSGEAGRELDALPLADRLCLKTGIGEGSFSHRIRNDNLLAILPGRVNSALSTTYQILRPVLPNSAAASSLVYFLLKPLDMQGFGLNIGPSRFQTRAQSCAAAVPALRRL